MPAAFNRLIHVTSTYKITLLMPPRAPGHPVAEDKTRLRRLINTSVIKLIDAEVDERSATSRFTGLLGPGDLRGADSTSSRASYISDVQRTVVSVPFELSESAAVGNNFALSPLAPLIKPERFVLVAIARGSVEAAIATRFGYEKLELPDAPSGLAEVVQCAGIERQLRSHFARGGGQVLHGAWRNRKQRTRGSAHVRPHGRNGSRFEPEEAALVELARVAGSDKCERDLPRIVDAARQGRVRALLFRTEPEPSSSNDDIETAALETWRAGGDVLRTDRIDAVAAVLRY